MWQDSTMEAQWFVLSFCLLLVPRKCSSPRILKVLMQLSTQFHFCALADTEGGFLPRL